MYEVTLKDRKYTIRQADFSTDDYKHIQQLFYKYFPKSLVSHHSKIAYIHQNNHY